MTKQSGTADIGGSRTTGAGFQEAAGDVGEQAGRAAEAQATQALSQVGHTLEQVAQAIREAGEGLRQDQPQMAGFADTAAGKVEEVSRYLGEHDPRDILDSAQNVARREPIVVVGAGLLAGLALGRLLKSTSGGNGGWSRGRGYGNGGYGSYAGGYGSDAFGGGYAGSAGYGGAYGASSGDATGSTGGAYAGGTAGGRATGSGTGAGSASGSGYLGDLDPDPARTGGRADRTDETVTGSDIPDDLRTGEGSGRGS